MTNTTKALVETLDDLGVEYIFGYPGGRVIEVLDEVPDSPITLVRPRDEREASVMAEVHGRLTQTPGVLAGQGPWIGSLGAIGQMEGRLSSSPMVAITEASERGEYSTLAPYQQSRGDYGGLDLPNILDSITKEHWFPRTPTETIRSLQLAFKHAVAGRPGPTAVILDGDAVHEEVPEDPTPPVWNADEQVRTWKAAPAADDLDDAADALASAERPVIVAGNGVHAAQAYDELQAAAEAYDAVVVTSYLGKSTIPETHELAGGVIGSFSHEGANQLVSNADVLCVVGCRLNPMDTNWQAPGFIRPDEQRIIHADIDARNAGWVYPADVGLIGDATHALTGLEARAGEDAGAEPEAARDRAAQAREDFHAPACESDASPIKPQRAIKEIEAVVDAGTIVTADSGNNRFWLLNYLQTPGVRTYFGSGGVGGMGWSVPAGVSAALTTDRDVVSVAGDGGFAMTMNSVETAVEYGVAPTFVVLNDTSLGMVRQMQEADGDIAGVEFHDTDFVAVAEAFGAVGERVTAPDEFASALVAGKERNDRPTVIDVRIDRDEEMEAELTSSFYDAVGGLHE
ncbi:thiamine pyrophosphate-dependent enzyme, possible carboligase or decarboxylase [Halovivax ruber XH-70]|uniref:Thiamine pyrophosphate-dependent enzyme, possible carboligase or decarboxylase n=1 Tax=Halovivax ruber (strain DSM 18193 / JCM 13892 / XH-70) TaxID=797302 RepID=L0IDH3_HALRX|nr:thiamine pyrophosphate-binding protein [Halovivax ruber]AGB16276.1 thiamine pyrophosphate-dependent enzyme, possible carboligase or decarboxylase [Halovivax ruber XH-70]